MRALSRKQFAAYATAQIEVAKQIFASHQRRVGGWCSCGKLALLDATTVLPVVICPAEPQRAPLWRRMIAGLQ